LGSRNVKSSSAMRERTEIPEETGNGDYGGNGQHRLPRKPATEITEETGSHRETEQRRSITYT
jgi:hypothetical protein